MTTYYEIDGRNKEKKYFCDHCKKHDGRPTLCWIEKDFNLCLKCLQEIYSQNPLPPWSPENRKNLDNIVFFPRKKPKLET